MSGTVSGWQASITNNPLALDVVFVLAVIGLLVAWKFMVEGLLE